MTPSANEILQSEAHGAPVHDLDESPLQLLVVIRCAARGAQADRAAKSSTKLNLVPRFLSYRFRFAWGSGLLLGIRILLIHSFTVTVKFGCGSDRMICGAVNF